MLYYNALDFYAHVTCPLRFVPVLYTGVLAKLFSGQAAKFVAASVWLTGQYRRTGIRTLGRVAARCWNERCKTRGWWSSSWRDSCLNRHIGRPLGVPWEQTGGVLRCSQPSISWTARPGAELRWNVSREQSGDFLADELPLLEYSGDGGAAMSQDRPV